jgi:hypothetical protein
MIIMALTLQTNSVVHGLEKESPRNHDFTGKGTLYDCKGSCFSFMCDA